MRNNAAPQGTPHSALCTPQSVGLVGVSVEESARHDASRADPRFWMLETIREYAWEQLLECGEGETARRQHARYFLGIVERAEPELVGTEQGVWLDRLDAEHDNLRAAISSSLETGEPGDLEIAARLSSSLRRFWYLRAYISEGRRWLEAVMSRGEALPQALRARVLHALGTLAWSQGDYASARSLFV